MPIVAQTGKMALLTERVLQSASRRGRAMTQEELLKLIERAEHEQWTELDLRGQRLRIIPSQIGTLDNLKLLLLGPSRDSKDRIENFNFLSELRIFPKIRGSQT